MTRRNTGFIAGALAASLLALGGCREIPDVEPEPVRFTAPGVLELGAPETVEKLRRPAVEFDHDAHTEALEDEGCERCHATGEDGAHDFDFVDVAAIESRGDLLEAYHDGCAECHDEKRAAGKDTGPETTVCATCHVKQPPTGSARVAPHFDRSLHGRHTVALEDRCEDCHHASDGAGGRVHREGEEAACSVCHKDDTGEAGEPPLRQASHDACVDCHLQRAGKNTGPTTCGGCHDEEALGAVAKLAAPPRIERGQEDQVSIHADWSEVPEVPFDHAAHEGRTGRCSDCHHASLEACDSCHTESGLPDGGGVGLEQAYHEATSTHSCVGCHDDETERKSCAGCHVAIPSREPSPRSCARCHVDAPPPQGEEPPHPTVWTALPPSSEAFPEEIVIDVMADEYEASTFPHRQIVEALDRDIRDSELATHFHGTADATCTGCHHHTPTGERPPPCSSCHGPTDRMDQDRPSLKHAYHRQCMGCHEAMDIEEQGCTDCHAKAPEEDSK